MDSDGLVAAGESGVQLTWMDAKVGDSVLTPRMGKPVEIQALWLNALAFAIKTDRRWQNSLELGLRTFRERFWRQLSAWQVRCSGLCETATTKVSPRRH